MEQITNKLKPKDGQSKGEWMTIIILRVLALLFMVTILYVPAYTRLQPSMDNVDIPDIDMWYLLGCIVIFGSPGKIIGQLLAALGNKLLQILNINSK